MADRTYILYDSRACGDNGTEDAAVLVACSSDRAAKSFKGNFGSMACYSYRVEGNELVDERWEWDYWD